MLSETASFAKAAISNPRSCNHPHTTRKPGHGKVPRYLRTLVPGGMPYSTLVAVNDPPDRPVPFAANMPRKAKPLSAASRRQLQRLYKRKQKADVAQRQAADELALETQRVSDQEGASRRTIAMALGASASTVQGWADRAERLGQQ